ncbi:MAG: helix-turn-helix domain-containing protein [Actinobacteria bacterium]|nr:helix-turn-helix domain-containing protein [Actinomycetota bacterium]
MTQMRIPEAAEFLGVSDDTVRRWIESGRLAASADAAGRQVIDGAEVARAMREGAGTPASAELAPIVSRSARNRFAGVVTRIVKDTVMAQVEIQAGPHRFISLLSTEAVDELGLEPGSLAIATVKATNVGVEVPGR